MPGYFEDDTVLRVCVEDIEETIGKAKLRGKDDEWWRKLSDAMWQMIDVWVAADLASDSWKLSRRRRRAVSG